MLKEGMYVEFIDYDNNGRANKKIGQWISEKSGRSQVFCHSWDGEKRIITNPLTYETCLLNRAEIREGAKCIVNGCLGSVIRVSKKDSVDSYKWYYCSIIGKIGKILVSESQIKVQFDDLCLKIEDLFLDGDFCLPNLFLDRLHIKQYVSLSNLVPSGYDSVVGKKINLYEHQLDTIKRVTDKQPIRAILADEVGLGKTIEALSILDYARQAGIAKRILIVVPDQLKSQWNLEAISKFNLNASWFMYSDFLKRVYKSDIIIISDNEFVRYYDDFKWNSFDMLICDEVHKAIRKKSKYNCIFKMAKLVPNVLLLSATPLLEKGNEMFRLLRLLNPDYYSRLGLKEFTRIISVRKKVIEAIESVSYGFEMSPDKDHALKCLYTFKDLAINIADTELLNTLSQINMENEKEIVEAVKIVFDYLDLKYEIAPKYIRHRRADILDPTSKRCLFQEGTFYYPNNGAVNEDIQYQTLRDELEISIKEKAITVENVMELGNAFFSSATALNRILIDKDLYKVLPKTYAVNHKLQKIENDFLASARLDKLIETIKNNIEILSSKTVIFTDYYQSAQLVYKRLVKEFGDSKVLLYSSYSETGEHRYAENNFKSADTVKILVCDKRGTEGKNFQFADYIIHFDTPWLPTELEQRIGRLDRIGRKPNSPVHNIVLYSKDTIEEDLIAMYKNDLNIYEESLSGIEIVFDQITSLIKESINNNALLGFDLVSDEIKQLKQMCEDAIQQEEFDQMCFQAEEGYVNKSQDVITNLTGAHLEKFAQSLCNWHRSNGYDVRFENDIVYLEGMPSKGLQDIKGSFYVDESVRENSARYLSLHIPLIKKITDDAICDNSKKVTAVRIKKAGFHWSGFIGIWDLQLYMREFFDYDWEDRFEKIPYMYIDEAMMYLSDSYSGEAIAADILLENLEKSISENNFEKITVRDVEDLLDEFDIEHAMNRSINNMKKEFMELISYRINHEKLSEDIEKSRREYKTNQLLRYNMQNSKVQLDLLNASKTVFNNYEAKLDSLLFVRFEE